MRLSGRDVLRLAAGLVALLAVAALSRVPVSAVGADQGVLRLAWRVVADGAENCVPLTEEELERRPAHMRADDCEVRLPEYELRVRVDGELRLDERVRHSGARGDRPAYVFHEIRVPPGRRSVEVRFTTLAGAGTSSAPLTWTGERAFARGQVRLITLEAGALVERP